MIQVDSKGMSWFGGGQNLNIFPLALPGEGGNEWSAFTSDAVNGYPQGMKRQSPCTYSILCYTEAFSPGHSMLRLLKRFRLPLAFGIVTLLILAYVLQPRPMAEYRLTGNYAAIKMSPSGNYLAKYEESILQIYQLPGMELVHTCEWNPGFYVEFDANDNLLFANYASAIETPEGATLQLWHWQQGQSKPRLVTSRKPFPPDHPHAGHFSSDSFNGLFELNDKFISHCILSPDARQWLIPVTDGTSIRFELVDAQSGNSVPLEIPSVEIKNPSIGNLTVAFSQDSNELVTDSSPRTPADEYRKASRLLRWFDVRSGKLLHSKVLQSPDIFDHYGRLHLLTRERVVGLDREAGPLILQSHTDAGGHQSILLYETQANPIEQPWPKSTDRLWVASPDYDSQLDSSRRLLIYWWEHHLLPKGGGFSGVPPCQPGFSFGVRELSSGKLIHTERLPERQRKPGDWNHEGWRMLAVLPDSVLMLQQPPQEPPPWQLKWEEWRREYIPWCPSLPTGPLHLLFLEATTGKRLSELSLPFTDVYHRFHPKQHALYLVGYNTDELVIQKYAYPLRKPWLFICTWALSVAVSLTLPVEVRRWFKRRKAA